MCIDIGIEYMLHWIQSQLLQPGSWVSHRQWNRIRRRLKTYMPVTMSVCVGGWKVVVRTQGVIKDSSALWYTGVVHFWAGGSHPLCPPCLHDALPLEEWWNGCLWEVRGLGLLWSAGAAVPGEAQGLPPPLFLDHSQGCSCLLSLLDKGPSPKVVICLTLTAICCCYSLLLLSRTPWHIFLAKKQRAG